MVRRAEGQIRKTHPRRGGFYVLPTEQYKSRLTQGRTRTCDHLQSTQFFRVRQWVWPSNATIGMAWECLKVQFLAIRKRHKRNPHTGRTFRIFVADVDSPYYLPIIIWNYPAVNEQVQDAAHSVVAIPAYLVAVPKLKAQRIRTSVQRVRVLLPNV